MKGLAAVAGLCAALFLAACSAQDATSHVATFDAPAAQACRDVRALVQARAAQMLKSSDLRARLVTVYNEAQASENPVVRARALVLFTDATEMAAGDEGQSFAGDLAAMQQTCSGQAT